MWKITESVWILRTSLFIACGTLTACGSRELKVPVTPTFGSIQRIVIGPKCLQCHSSLSTYAGVMQIVEPGNPGSSAFYESIRSGEMPQRSPKLSKAEVQAVQTWILNGANHD